MSELITKYGHQLTQHEIDVIDCVLKNGKGLAVKSKAQLKDYPNLINNQLVYTDTWGGSITLRPTTKGDAFFNDIKQP